MDHNRKLSENHLAPKGASILSQKINKEESHDDWETPEYIFELIEKKLIQKFEVGKFTLDGASSDFNTKCEEHYTLKDNSLDQDWSGNVFLNPPFSELKNGKWTEKAYKEGLKPDTFVVMIIPSSTGTRYWHDHIMKAHEIWFPKGRINYCFNGVMKTGVRFDSCIIIFTKTENDYPRIFPFEHQKFIPKNKYNQKNKVTDYF